MTKEQQDTAHKEIANRLDYLAGRWGDEGQYENFADYETNMKAMVEAKGGVFISLSKRPFEVKYRLDATAYILRIKGNKISLFIEE